MSHNYYNNCRENYQFSLFKPSTWCSCENEVKTERNKCIADRNELASLKGITCPISVSQYENLVKENEDLRKKINNITQCYESECVVTEIFRITITALQISFSGRFKGAYEITFLDTNKQNISSVYRDNNQQYRSELIFYFNDEDKKNINNFKFIKIDGLNGFKNTIPIEY
jgi:hypothetical protein